MSVTLLIGFVKLLNVIYYRVVPIVLLSLLSYGIWCLIEKARGQLNKHDTQVRGAALGFSFVGIAVGIMVAGSREPIAQAGVSGFLGLVTAFAGYAFAKDSLAKFRPFAVPIVMTLSMTLVFGLYYGSALREDREAYEKNAAQGAAIITALSSARTEICKQAALTAIESKTDPIQALSPTCQSELGFIALKIKESN